MIRKLSWLFVLVLFIAACGEDDPPPEENEEEVITDVTLTWTPVAGGMTVTARAQDPDGEGPQDLQILDAINLNGSASYVLTIELDNTISGESITEEIEEEADEHMFFFEWTNGAFMGPSGDGNADNRNDPVNYNDTDSGGLPLGLSTNWTTASGISGGAFRVVLKHQPDGIKSASSDIQSGDTDIDLTWVLNIN